MRSKSSVTLSSTSCWSAAEQVAAALRLQSGQERHDPPDDSIVGAAERGQVAEWEAERLVGDGVEHLAGRRQPARVILVDVAGFEVVRGIAGQAAVTVSGHVHIVGIRGLGHQSRV